MPKTILRVSAGAHADLGPLPQYVKGNAPENLGAKLKAWWNANDNASITQGSGVVSAWADQVGGYVLAQATSGARPAYQSTGLGGKPCLAFDGTDDFMSLTGAPAGLPTGSNESWIWAVIENRKTTGAIADIAGYGSNANSRKIRHTASFAFTVSAGSQIISTIGITSRHFVGGRFASATVSGRVDGVATAWGAATFNTGTSLVRLGSDLGGTAGTFFQGAVSHLLVTSGLTATEIAMLETWGAWQAGKQ
jgi:hypothetical protein